MTTHVTTPTPTETASPTAREEVLALARRFKLAPEHPEACLAEARAHVAAPGFDDPSLADRRALPFVTIDNDDSRDLDQALCLVDGPGEDEATVYYALADAAYYVRPGSALFTEALARAVSYYLPGLVVPMLPRVLSEDLVSLNEAVPRRALLFRVVLGPDGDARAVGIERALVTSRRKLSYRQVQRHWDGLAPDDPARPLAGQDFSRSLELLREVGRKRVRLAEARHVVQYQRIEVDIGFADPQGRAFIAFETKRYESDRMNEQISLLVNVEGARFLAARSAPGTQAIFRVHPAPMAPDLTAFAAMTRALIEAHGRPHALAWDARAESLAAWLERIEAAQTDDPSLAGLALTLQRQALLLNQRSTFSAEPGLHFGVGAPCYARFSSPMREVVGIFTHKEALEALGLEPPRPDLEDEELRVAVIAAANRAKDLQHQLTKAANQLVIDATLAADLAHGDAPERVGTLVGLGPDRLYVLIDEPPLELKVYARDLGPRWSLTPTTLSTTGPDGERSFVLGQRVALRVVRHDDSRDRWVLAIAHA